MINYITKGKIYTAIQSLLKYFLEGAGSWSVATFQFASKIL